MKSFQSIVLLSLIASVLSDKLASYGTGSSIPLDEYSSGGLLGAGSSFGPVATSPVLIDPIAALEEALPGVPGSDYPILAEIPQTSFSCAGQVEGGYYADPDTDCQVFHICVVDEFGGLGKQSFLCANGTIFNQESFTCDWWFNFDCSQATAFYSKNDEIAAEREVASGLIGSGSAPAGYDVPSPALVPSRYGSPAPQPAPVSSGYGSPAPAPQPAPAPRPAPASSRYGSPVPAPQPAPPPSGYESPVPAPAASGYESAALATQPAPSGYGSPAPTPQPAPAPRPAPASSRYGSPVPAPQPAPPLSGYESPVPAPAASGFESAALATQPAPSGYGSPPPIPSSSSYESPQQPAYFF